MGNIVVSGAAGFIGSAVCRALLSRGDRVCGIDNLDAGYDPAIKKARMESLAGRAGFDFLHMDLSDRDALRELFTARRFDAVLHLAARAGIRDSMSNPEPYFDSNLTGFGNFADAACRAEVNHFLFASSSSVYGDSGKLPWSEDDPLGRPRSLYAATKLAGELIAASYAERMPCTGLRYFTVYGPGNRPDMGIYRFAAAIREGRALLLHNAGDMERDLIYVDDVVQGTLAALDQPPGATLRVRNLGTGRSCSLPQVIGLLEQGFGRKAVKKPVPMLSVEVPVTRADMSHFIRDYGYRPATSLERGIERFIAWFTARTDRDGKDTGQSGRPGRRASDSSL